LNATSSGVWSFCADINGASLPGLPCSIQVSPAKFDASTSFLIEPSGGFMSTTAGEFSNFIVQAVDEYGNVVEEVPMDLEVVLVSGAYQVPHVVISHATLLLHLLLRNIGDLGCWQVQGNIQRQKSGVFSVMFSLEKAAEFDVSATFGQIHVRGSPFRILNQAAAPSARVSVLRAPKVPLLFLAGVCACLH
jgi:hypothetical protein